MNPSDFTQGQRDYIESLVLAKLTAEGVDLQGDPEHIRATLKGCANSKLCTQVALDMRSRRQGQNKPQETQQGRLFA